MAEESWIWDGAAGGDAGPYAADDWDDMYEMLHIGALAASAGVRPRYLNELKCTSAAPNVAVASGGAVVKGKPYKNSASVNVNIPIPVVDTRWDVIVLRAVWASWTIRITRVAGVEGAGVPPAITQNDGVTWDLPLANVSCTIGGVITIEEDLRRPTDQGMNMLPGAVMMWEGTLSGRNPVIDSLIYDEWCVCDGGAAYNGWTINDWADRIPMGVGATVAAVAATAGALTKNLVHTHGPGTLSTGINDADHNHANANTNAIINGANVVVGSGLLNIAYTNHQHSQGATGLTSGTHGHTVTGGVTANGGSAVQDVLNPVIGTYFLKYAPA